jgi:hypothetical protein
MSYVVSIDVGVKNVGICVFDFRSCKVVCWENTNLVSSGRYMPSQNVTYVMEFIKKYKTYFDDALTVLLERQMRCNMRIIESIIHALHHNKAIVISPRAVKMHYDISTRNYKNNKERAVEWVDKFVVSNASAFESKLVLQYEAARKKDDYADALMMLLYYLDTYSKHLNTTVVDNFEFDVGF